MAANLKLNAVTISQNAISLLHILTKVINAIPSDFMASAVSNTFFLSRYLTKENLITENTTSNDISKLFKEKVGGTCHEHKTKSCQRPRLGLNTMFLFPNCWCSERC